MAIPTLHLSLSLLLVFDEQSKTFLHHPVATPVAQRHVYANRTVVGGDRGACGADDALA